MTIDKNKKVQQNTSSNTTSTALPKNQRAQMRDERMEQIRQVTKELVLKEGFGANLMSRIAKECGISRQRLYCYYDNQNAILSDIHDLSVQNLAQKLHNVPLLEDATEDTLQEFLPHVFALNDDFMFLAIYEVYRKKNHLTERTGGPIENTFVFMKYIQKGQEAGRIRTDFTAMELDYLIGQLLHSFYYKAMILQDESLGKLLLDDRVVSEFGIFIQSFLKGDSNQP